MTRQLADAALAQAARRNVALPEGAPLTLVFAGNRTLHGLNRSFRGKDKPTNVLSFPLVGGGGDVILALETVQAEALAQGKPVAHHAAHLIVHGILHVLGYDHDRQANARTMESLERQVLAHFGIADPYA
jgi:probable rRNA maturation factor